MTRFRPCIDLHAGQVKQIVGGTLSTEAKDLKTNYVSTLPAGHFADMYKHNNAVGAHVVMLGPGNEQAAKEALSAWPEHLQIGGGITDENAKKWIDAGADKVVLPSFLSGTRLVTFHQLTLDRPCRRSEKKMALTLQAVGHNHNLSLSIWPLLLGATAKSPRRSGRRQG